MVKKARVPASKKRSSRTTERSRPTGEFHLDLSGIGKYDYATRACMAFPYPKGVKLQVTSEFHAGVVDFGGRIGAKPSSDVVVIYLSATDTDNGFKERGDEDAEAEYIQDLAKRGWKFHRFGAMKDVRK